ncbi:hypothetical protein ACWKW9_10320 [Rhizobium daejeonense]
MYGQISSRLSAFTGRIRWSDRDVQMRAAFIVPIFFGFFSVVLGADTNWDLYNYHVYGPFALLNGKLDIDLAPAGFQGYFNPLLDVPVYLLNSFLPGFVTGFILGFLHGLSFVPLLGIARTVLDGLGEKQRWLPLFLALAGCLTPNFLTGIGNGMGDNTTALLILFAVWLLIANWQRLENLAPLAVGVLGLAGLLGGFAVGLKLTNGASALAVCIALLCYPSSIFSRLRIAFIFGVGVLAGTALTGGYWMFEMWTRFGNPLFPQFGSLFPNELANPSMIADTRWLPKSILEYFLWPFIISLNSRRAGEMNFTQFIWPVAYVLYFVHFVRWAWLRISERKSPARDPRGTFVLAFVAISYVIWMLIFSIFRYTIAIEMLLPLAIFLLLARFLPEIRAARVSAWLVSLSTILMVVSGVPNWGHESWGEPHYAVELPPLDDPKSMTVLMPAMPKKRPLGWVISQFSPEIAFIGIENSFPASNKYRERGLEIAGQRGGSIYVMVNGEASKRARRMKGFADTVDWLGLTASTNGCGLLKAAVEKFDLRAAVSDNGAKANGALCRLGLRPQDEVDVGAANKEYVELARQMVGRAGFTLDPQSCTTYAASIGGSGESYQFCRAALAD